jgi:adenine C2-methylase RlmN of 23S rRNA A2503 and tRNA A37
MVKARKLSPLPIFDEGSVRAFMEERGIKQLHARQMWKLICKHRPERLEAVDALSMKEMGRQLPTGMVAAFAEQFTVTSSKVVEKHESRDGTIKLLVELQDGQRVEAVIIRHDGRNTLCVSSQIGCQMGCTFCATGTMGIKGNLWGGEILEAGSLKSPRAVCGCICLPPWNPGETHGAVLRSLAHSDEHSPGGGLQRSYWAKAPHEC